jgi:hypothetical protein
VGAGRGDAQAQGLNPRPRQAGDEFQPEFIAAEALGRPDHRDGLTHHRLAGDARTADTIAPEVAGWNARSRHATQAGAQAFARLLALAETRDSGQISRVARFLAATYDGDAFPYDPFELRAVDVAISDDMLCCLDALRWGRADLYTLVPDGDARVRAVIARWELAWPGNP